MRKLRTLLATYREAGGAQPIVLLHDEAHGSAADRRAGAPRRRPAGQCAAARGQRGDAGRARSDRGGLRLWRRGAALPAARAGRATTSTGLQQHASRWPSRSWPGSASAAARVAHDRDRRSRRARRGAARDRSRRAGAAAGELPAGRRQARRAAAGAARAAPRGARAGRRRSRCRRARRSARSRSTSRAARSASPACRPARPARCRTIPSGRCCASPRTPACSAGCARRPARRR